MTARDDAELDFAVRELRRNYDRAVKSPYIHTPIAWALYHTWRMVDTRANRRREEGRHKRSAAALADPEGGSPERKTRKACQAEAGEAGEAGKD